MDKATIQQQCTALTDRELIRSLTRDQSDYHKDFRQAASEELSRRGLTPSDALNRVAFGLNDGEPEPCAIEGALAKLEADVPLWSIQTFTNYLDETLIIQNEPHHWLIHYYDTDQYQHSFIAYHLPHTLLANFLSLKPWGNSSEPVHNLNTWKPLFQSRSVAYFKKLAAELHAAHIPHTVQTPTLSQHKKQMLVLLTSDDHLQTAQEIITENERKLRALYDQATQLADTEDREQELAHYDRLVQLAPDNPAVFYNRGSTLLELGRLNDAVESFTEAVSLGLPEIDASKLTPGRRSGAGRLAGSFHPVLGLVAMAAQQTGPAQRPSEYPDYIDDAELFLIQILEQQPENIPVLHCLATIAELKDNPETAIRHYRNILAHDPTDETAKTNLEYLQAFEEEDT